MLAALHADDPLPQPSSIAGIPVAQGHPVEAKEKKSSFERGFRFGDVSDLNSTAKPKSTRAVTDILEEILKVQKDQLKEQKRIREILEDQYDPQPKKIVVDGKECIENSTAECFQMPLLHPDAKKVPVLAAFVRNPSVETAREYLRWYAKFLKSAYRGGESIVLAVNQYGAQAYPMNFDRFDYDTPGAYSSVLKQKNNKLVLNTLSKEIEFYFFLGKNPDADLYAVDNYAKFTKELPDVKCHLVFYSEGSKKAFVALSSRLKNIGEFKDGLSSMLVSPEAFKKHNVYATPMVGMLIKSSNKMRSILVGRNSADGIIENAVDALEYDKVLKDAHSPGYEKWKRTGDYSSKYYKDIYGVDLNETYIKKTYKENTKKEEQW
jgi:hypothetical protein